MSEPQPSPLRFRLAAIAGIGTIFGVGLPVVLREVMAAAGGDELAIGKVLLTGCTACAIGLLLGGRTTRLRVGQLPGLTAACGLATAGAAWTIGRLGADGPVEVDRLPLGLVAVMALPALLAGLSFPLAVRLARGHLTPDSAALTATAAGATVAAGAYGLITVWSVAPASNVLLATVLAVALLCLARLGRRIAWLWLLAPLAMLLPTWRQAGPAGGALATTEGPSARLAADADHSGYAFRADGRPVGGTPASERRVALVHCALAQVMPLRSVVMIGGFTDEVAAALRWQPGRLAWYGATPRLPRFAMSVMGGAAGALWLPVVEPRSEDARLALREESDLDAVLVLLPDPVNTRLNRYYTVEFFLDVRARLTSSGVFAIGLDAALGSLKEPSAELHRTLYHTLHEAFPEVIFLPRPGVFLAGARPGTLSRDGRPLQRRLVALGTSAGGGEEPAADLTAWLNPEVLAQAEASLVGWQSARLNKDFSPAGRWAAAEAERERPPGFGWLGLAAGALALLAAVVLGGRTLPSVGAALAAAIAGYAGGTLFLVLVFAFQAAYGFAYWMLGLLSAGSLAGITLGCYWSTRQARQPRAADSMRLRLVSLAVMLMVAPVLLGMFDDLVSLTRRAEVVPFVFPLLAALVGAFVGTVFPTALLRTLGDRHRAVSGVLAAGMLGAGVAGGVVGPSLMPAVGLATTCSLAAMLCLVTLPTVWRSTRSASSGPTVRR